MTPWLPLPAMASMCRSLRRSYLLRLIIQTILVHQEIKQIYRHDSFFISHRYIVSNIDVYYTKITVTAVYVLFMIAHNIKMLLSVTTGGFARRH